MCQQGHSAFLGMVGLPSAGLEVRSEEANVTPRASPLPMSILDRMEDIDNLIALGVWPCVTNRLRSDESNPPNWRASQRLTPWVTDGDKSLDRDVKILKNYG